MLKILIAVHDAGGAEILSAMMRKYRDSFSWAAVVAGPAKKVFDKKGLPYTEFNGRPEDAVRDAGPDLVLTGCGWFSPMEVHFIKAAKKLGLRSAMYLDHWVNYAGRLSYPRGDPWSSNLPDSIFVGDSYALDIAARDGFPEKRLVRVENPYFEEIISEAKKKSAARRPAGKTLLFISDPISEAIKKGYGNEKRLGCDEFRIFNDLKRLMELDRPPVDMVRIRLHPAEKDDKYDGLLKAASGIYVSDRKKTLVDDCLESEIVLSIESMALIVALMVGRNAISYIPCGGECLLPHKEIIRVTSFEGLLATLRRLRQAAGEGCAWAGYDIKFPDAIKAMGF